MSFILTTSNDIKNKVPIVTAPNTYVGLKPINMTRTNHAFHYVAGGGTGDIIIEIPDSDQWEYAAISGHNIAQNGDRTLVVQIYDVINDLWFDGWPFTITDSAPFLIYTGGVQGFNVRFKIVGNPDVHDITICNISSGSAMLSGVGGPSGSYRTPSDNNPIVTTTVYNQYGQPIATRAREKAFSASMNFRNVLRVDAETKWQEFMAYASREHFFVKELSNDFFDTSSIYVGYNPTIKFNESSKSRTLIDINLKFDVYNGAW